MVDETGSDADGVVDETGSDAGGVVDETGSDADGVVDETGSDADGVVDETGSDAGGVIDSNYNMSVDEVDVVYERHSLFRWFLLVIILMRSRFLSFPLPLSF